jgi:hypothetical protein
LNDRRQRSLVLAVLRDDLRGDRNRQILGFLPDDLPDPLLVGRVEIGVQQRDGQRLDARLVEVSDGFSDRGLVQRFGLLAVR